VRNTATAAITVVALSPMAQQGRLTMPTKTKRFKLQTGNQYRSVSRRNTTPLTNAFDLFYPFSGYFMDEVEKAKPKSPYGRKPRKLRLYKWREDGQAEDGINHLVEEVPN
jgi:hypothetical protein